MFLLIAFLYEAPIRNIVIIFCFNYTIIIYNYNSSRKTPRPYSALQNSHGHANVFLRNVHTIWARAITKFRQLRSNPLSRFFLHPREMTVLVPDLRPPTPVPNTTHFCERHKRHLLMTSFAEKLEQEVWLGCVFVEFITAVRMAEPRWLLVGQDKCQVFHLRLGWLVVLIYCTNQTLFDNQSKEPSQQSQYWSSPLYILATSWR